MPSSKPIEEAIVALLRHRRSHGTICPSEVARKLAPKEWKTLMRPVREAAAQMALEGRVIATQKGKEVNALSARGPIRLKATESILRED